MHTRRDAMLVFLMTNGIRTLPLLTMYTWRDGRQLEALGAVKAPAGRCRWRGQR